MPSSNGFVKNEKTIKSRSKNQQRAHTGALFFLPETNIARRLTLSQLPFVLNAFFTLAPTRAGTFNSCSHTRTTRQPIRRS
jgi:hypothetical protein